MCRLGFDVLFAYLEDTNLIVEARDNFLNRYQGETRKMYDSDLYIWFNWCSKNEYDPMVVKRRHLEQFSGFLINEKKNSPRSVGRRLQTLRTFYKLAVADELITYNPTIMLRSPKWEADPEKIVSLDRMEVKKLLDTSKETSPAHHVLVSLMVMLGLRVSEACSINIEDFQKDKADYVIVKVLRKGNRYTIHPIPIPLFKIVDSARGDRKTGPLILTKSGNRQNRNGAYAWVKSLLKKAGLNENAHPHTLRHSSITALIDAGEPIHKVKEFADHRDIRMTEHYYRRSGNTSVHSAHVAARLYSY